MGFNIIRGIGVVCVVVGLLAWGAYAVKLNSPEMQTGPFVVVLGTADVLDVRTSLSWQQAPGAPGDTVSPCDNGNACTWQEAKDYCEAAGNGSRLPKQRELISLIDHSVPSPGPFLPAGHPFQKVVSAFYWSATENVSSPMGFWHVHLKRDAGSKPSKGRIFSAWCVRGGQAYDGQNIVPPAMM